MKLETVLPSVGMAQMSRTIENFMGSARTGASKGVRTVVAHIVSGEASGGCL